MVVQPRLWAAKPAGAACSNKSFHDGMGAGKGSSNLVPFLERWPSGRRRSPAKRVEGDIALPRVQIPPSPQL
jgi:hypothetical protein